MPPLRIISALGVLVLVAAIAGTAWLSGLTAAGYRPDPAAVAMHTAPLPHARVAARNSRPSVHRQLARSRDHAIGPPHVVGQGVVVEQDVTVDRVAELARGHDELVPQVMSMDDSESWQRLRGHLDGQVLLAVSVDGAGRVTAANVAQSSGDELLDAHALRSIRQWRFAVPPDRADGLSGEVPMRFSSRSR